jgi:hypothetical protein
MTGKRKNSNLTHDQKLAVLVIGCFTVMLTGYLVGNTDIMIVLFVSGMLGLAITTVKLR